MQSVVMKLRKMRDVTHIRVLEESVITQDCGFMVKRSNLGAKSRATTHLRPPDLLDSESPSWTFPTDLFWAEPSWLTYRSLYAQREKHTGAWIQSHFMWKIIFDVLSLCVFLYRKEHGQQETFWPVGAKESCFTALKLTFCSFPPHCGL